MQLAVLISVMLGVELNFWCLKEWSSVLIYLFIYCSHWAPVLADTWVVLQWHKVSVAQTETGWFYRVSSLCSRSSPSSLATGLHMTSCFNLHISSSVYLARILCNLIFFSMGWSEENDVLLGSLTLCLSGCDFDSFAGHVSFLWV